MDSPQQMTSHTHHADASRPALGFPLGTALLLIVIFCLSGLFSCCYHWEKLRSLRRSFSRSDTDTNTIDPSPPPKSTSAHKEAEKKERESLPVIMPGDEIPKYMAWPCPCPCPCPCPSHQPTDTKKKVTIEVQSPQLALAVD